MNIFAHLKAGVCPALGSAGTAPSEVWETAHT